MKSLLYILVPRIYHLVTIRNSTTGCVFDNLCRFLSEHQHLTSNIIYHNFSQILGNTDDLDFIERTTSEIFFELGLRVNISQEEKFLFEDLWGRRVDGGNIKRREYQVYKANSSKLMETISSQFTLEQSFMIEVGTSQNQSIVNTLLL